MLPEAPRPGARLVLTIDRSSWSVAAARVLSVGSAGAVLPLPLEHPGVSGLTQSTQGPVCLMDAGSGPQPTALHQVVMDSPAGPIALRVHTLRPLREGEPALPDFEDTLRALARSLSPARSGATRTATGETANAPQDTFLHVRSGETEVVLPARAVQRVGRHGGRRRLGSGTPATWLVALDDELVTTRSLAERGAAHGPLPEETWCLRFDGESPAAGLLASEVLGFVEAPRAQLRRLNDASGPSTWLLRADAAPLEVLAAPEAVPAPDAHTASAGPGAGSARPPVAGALCLHVSPWKLSLPASAVGEVLGRLEAGGLHATRTRGALPVLDLRRLREGAPRAATADIAWAVRVQAGGRPLILLAEFVETSRTPSEWAAAPALPPGLAPLVQAVRLDDSDTSELLLVPNARAAARGGPIRSFLRQAFAGWWTSSH